MQLLKMNIQGYGHCITLLNHTPHVVLYNSQTHLLESNPLQELREGSTVLREEEEAKRLSRSSPTW
jgi:hypothetical protein